MRPATRLKSFLSVVANPLPGTEVLARQARLRRTFEAFPAGHAGKRQHLGYVYNEGRQSCY